jgi:hypothetical protein
MLDRMENFERLGRSPDLGGREVFIDWEGGCVGRIFSPVISILLQHHVERNNMIPLITANKVLSTDLPTLFISGTRSELIRYHLIGMMRMRRISRSDSLIGYTDRKVLELREVNRSERSEILGG